MGTSSYYGDLGIFLYFAPIMGSLTAAFALLINRQRTYPQKWLAGVFLTLGVGMSCSFLFDRYMSADHTDIFRTVNFIISSGGAVSILLYYISLMRPRLLTRQFLFRAGVAWLLFSLMAALPEIVSLRIRPVPGIHGMVDFSSPWFLFRLLTHVCLVCVEGGMVVFGIRMYRKHCRLIKENFSFTEGVGLSWVRSTMTLFILLGVLDTLWMVNSTTEYKMLFNVASFVVIGVLFWFGFRQGEIPLPDFSDEWLPECVVAAASSLPDDEETIEPEDEKTIKSEDEKTIKLEDEKTIKPEDEKTIKPEDEKTIKLEDEKTIKLKVDLLHYFRTKKPFLNPELSLRDVALALGISHYALSRFINKEFGVNFYTLVFGYRIDYVLHLIELNHSTINCDTLFAASGFKSRTVFFEHFKKNTGCTPQEYIARLQPAKKKGRKKKPLL